MNLRNVLEAECKTKKSYGELYSRTLLSRQMLQQKIKQLQEDGANIEFDGSGVWVKKSREEIIEQNTKEYEEFLGGENPFMENALLKEDVETAVVKKPRKKKNG